MGTTNEASVEAYLQNNPEFVKKWFMKNVRANVLDDWLDRDSLATLSVTDAKVVAVGERNSLTCTLFKDLVEGKRKLAPKQTRKDKEELLLMTETELLMELIRDIANELDIDILCHKILLNVGMLTKSDRGSLFLVRGQKEKKFLVSKLFDVTETSSLEESLHTEANRIRVPFGVGIAGSVAETKQLINIKDAYEDSRFNKAIDKQTGYHTKSILCLPIFNYDGEVIGVAQIMNKTDGTTEFSDRDVELFKNYLTFCGIGLTNAELFEMSVQEYKRNQMLLRLARGICEEQANMDKLVQKVMLEAGELLECQRLNVYLLINSSEFEGGHIFSKAFELHAENNGNIITLGMQDLRESRAAAIAKDVVNSAEVLFLPDVVTDGRYPEQALVEKDGFRIQGILSLPVRNTEDKVIGVVQFMNKINSARGFTESDANMVEAFALFCGMGIYNCQMYEHACLLMAKQSVALEVLSYHASASKEDVVKLKESGLIDADLIGLYRYDFNDLPLTDDETCRATRRMFHDLKIHDNFHVPDEVICSFILSVKKNYRPVTYHNWRHAFNVSQTMFTMCFTGHMNKFLNDLEMFSMIVACLCHDLDHRGTNNAFQSKVESPVAQLYSTSTMEHHHFDQCIMILNSDGNNIFEHLSASEYKEAIRLVESAILSTDLALYFKKRGSFQELVESGEKEWQETGKKNLLRGMMMTACDVAAICKPWEVQREVAELVSGEFFEQGDLEREELNQEPIAMMDRKKKDELPKMQVGFIDAICLPIYKMLAQIEPGLEPLHEGCRFNRHQWQSLADEYERDPDASYAKKILAEKVQSDKPKQAKVAPTVRKETKEVQQDDDKKTGCISSACCML